MSNSALVTYTHITKHKNKGREGNKIQKIFVHHMAGCLTVKQCGNVFDNRQASAHYGVNGNQIGQYVREEDTAWHCGNWKWNLRSIGIELANDSGSPEWHVSETTINTAAKLIADICRRNGIPRLIYTGDMNGNLCMHRWVCSTSCPGPYLSKQFSRLCNMVNALLGGEFPSPYGKLEEDGIGGPDTVGTMQRFFGTQIDFVISGQNEDLKKYYPSLESVSFDDVASTCVRCLQRLVGAIQDGVLGPDTIKDLQKFLGVRQDGYWGPETMKKWQHYLNTHEHVDYSVKTAQTVSAPVQTAPAVSTPIVSTPKLYSGSFPTEEEIKLASRNGMFDRGVEWLEKIAADNTIHYVKYDMDAKAHNCFICKGYKDAKHRGGNCIWESFAFWRHGCDLNNTCNAHVIDNAFGTKLLSMTVKEATAQLKKKIGLKDIKVTISKSKNISPSKIPKGAICICYTKKKYYHTCPSIGGGKTIDCGNYKKKADQIKKRNLKNVRVVIEYTGGLTYLGIGDSGIAVTKLQKFLNWYFKDVADYKKLEEDGEFGPLTEAALKKYQSKNGLEVDGLAGSATFASMRKAVK